MRRLITIAAVLAAGLATAQDHQRVAVETTTRQVSVSAGNTAGHMPESLYSSCVGWWHFGRNNGTNYLDCSRSANNGTATNAATQPAWTNANGGALVFDGVNDAVRIENTTSLTNFNAFALSAWVYRDTTNTLDWVSVKGGSTGAGNGREWQLFFFDSGQIGANIFDDIGNDTIYIGRQGPCLTTGVWAHVVMVYGGGTSSASVQVYRDAERVDNADFATGAFDVRHRSNQAAHVGILTAGGVFSHPFVGRIGDISIFNGAFTGTQATNLYNATCRRYGLAPK